jgi:hypothetical protein
MTSPCVTSSQSDRLMAPIIKTGDEAERPALTHLWSPVARIAQPQRLSSCCGVVCLEVEHLDTCGLQAGLQPLGSPFCP